MSFLLLKILHVNAFYWLNYFFLSAFTDTLVWRSDAGFLFCSILVLLEQESINDLLRVNDITVPVSHNLVLTAMCVFIVQYQLLGGVGRV